MPKAKNSSKPKWVAKGSTEDLESQETGSPKASQSKGPKYDKWHLLRLYSACKDELGPRGKSTAPAAETDKAANEESVLFGFTERPADEEQPDYRKNKQAKKEAQRQVKRLSTQNLEEAVAGGDASTRQTPSGAYSLSEMLPETPMTPANHALSAYLQSMAAFAATPMYGMGYPGQTTVMLRNIPNRYTREMLCERLDQGYKAQYDFVYLPIDFTTKCNVGYAFINFRAPIAASRFMQEFHGAKTKQVLPGFGSSKVCEVSYARVQGRDQNMANLQDEKFMDKLVERPEWQPLFLDDEGKEIPYSTVMSSAGKKKRTSSNYGTPSHMMSPMAPTTPTGFMVPTPYGPMMYPTYPVQPTTAPAVTFSSVLPKATSETVLMLRGVPTSMTRSQLLDLLKEKYTGQIGFLFLPEEKTGGGGNRGFAFVNLTGLKKAKAFTEDFHEKKVKEKFPGVELPSEDDDKVCDVVASKLESLEKSIERTQIASLKNKEPSEWLPLLMDSQGKTKNFPTLTAAKTVSAAAKEQAAKEKAAKEKDESKDEKAESKEEAAQGEAEGKAAEGESKAGGEGKAAPSEKKKKEKQPKEKKEKGSGKGKDGKGQKGAAAAATAGYPAGYPGYMPYGGYSGYAGYVQQMQMAAAYQSAAMARAHAAYQQAAAGGSKQEMDFASLLDPLAAAVNPREGKPLSDEQKTNLRNQIEFYFSTQNLCKDLYLRSHMDEAGWTSIDLIAQFPQVRKYRATLKEIEEVLADSKLLEVDKSTSKLRLRDEEERSKWAERKVPTEYRELVSPANAPQGK
eukprot:TRINITY_DN32015_c0_g1_i1.p1 TRINITY_DN32015_c0_g1~~TRINITY_DN32015_c0_g1_i1.p1  ORF type:complete len:793 (-),score=216.30 TRINITY_DN32015_c0_g1_i1:145-2523(-)